MCDHVCMHKSYQRDTLLVTGQSLDQTLQGKDQPTNSVKRETVFQ